VSGVPPQFPAYRAKAPDLAQQLLLREDAAGLGGELQQQLVLLRRQVDPPASDRHAAGRPVDLERADAHEVRDDRRRPPQDGSDAGEQARVSSCIRDYTSAFEGDLKRRSGQISGILATTALANGKSA
jgi:hypothetical protein